MGNTDRSIYRDLQYAKFSAYGFLKNLRFFEPFLLLFFLEKGIGYLEIGTLFAVREISVNILEVPTGVLADALGRRRTMVGSFVSYLASFAVFYLGGGMLAFVPAMLLFALGDAFRTGTHKAMIMAYLSRNGWTDRKTDYYGHTRSWSQIGSAVSAVIAAAIVFYSGSYARIFLYSAIPYVLDLLLMLTYPQSLDGERTGFSGRELAAGLIAVFHDLRKAMKTPGLARTVAGASLNSGFYKGAKDYLQPLVNALALSSPFLVRHADEQRAAVFIGVVYSILYLLTSFASRNADRVAHVFASPRAALRWEMMLSLAVGLAAGALHMADLSLGAVLLFFLIYIIQNVRRPVAVSVVSDAFEDRLQATALSVESQLQSLFAAIVAFAIGAIAELAGGRVGVGLLAVSAVLLAVAPVLCTGKAAPPAAETA